jgi:hypothetical protein
MLADCGELAIEGLLLTTRSLMFLTFKLNSGVIDLVVVAENVRERLEDGRAIAGG